MPSSSSRYHSNVSAEHSIAVAAVADNIHRPVGSRSRPVEEDLRNPAGGIRRRILVEDIRHLVEDIHHLVGNLVDIGADPVGRNLLMPGLHLRRLL